MQRTIELSPKQLEFLNKENRIGLLVAGLGFGKSFIGALWLIMKVLKHPNAIGVMSSKDYGQLTNALDKEVLLVLSMMGMVDGIHFRRVRSPKLTYFFHNGSSIIGLSALNYDSAFRGININFLLMDELAFYEEIAFQTALGRVRKVPSQIRGVTTPQGFNFAWEYFLENPPPDSFVIRATTYDNELLPAEYIQSLKDSYPDKLFQQECMAEFIDLTAESAYFSFAKEFNVANINKIEGVQIYCGLDFNVSPMCSVIFQVIENKIRVFDEIVISDNADTYKFISILLSKYGKGVNIISDSTGSNRSTVGPSNHAILAKAGFNLVPSRNPFVFDRVMAVNKMLGEKRILIDNNCQHLIKCLSKTTWNKSGKLDQSKDRTLTHSSDSLGYAVCKLFPPAAGNYSNIDRSGSVLIESNQNY